MKHKHHIIPKHMGGSDEPSNLIELSIEEHAIAHMKLFEKYGKIEDKIAWKALSGNNDEFEFERRIMVSQKVKEAHKNGAYDKRNQSIKGQNNPAKRLDVRKKISKNNGMNKIENRNKVRDSKIGIPRSEETKNKLSISKSIYNYEITFPDGKIEITNNLWQFSKKHNLNTAAMWKTAKKLQSNHKGFKVVQR